MKIEKPLGQDIDIENTIGLDLDKEKEDKNSDSEPLESQTSTSSVLEFPSDILSIYQSRNTGSLGYLGILGAFLFQIYVLYDDN